MSEVLVRAIKNLVLQSIRQYIPLVARILLTPVFALAGVEKIMDPQGTIEAMSNAGLPFASLLLPVVILWLIGGGLSILTGFRTRIGAIALIVFLIPASVLPHGFWAYDPATEAFKLQMIMFLKNLGLMGGLLLLVTHGSGPYSIDSAMGRCDRD